MAKTIQELRREKGFRSAREFAEALGISPSSMSRYDKDPEAIPIKIAWSMADKLDCSIDEIVGRSHVTVGTSELQEFYDGLLPETQELMDDLIEFAHIKDKKARRQAKAEKDTKSERLCRFYERDFYQTLYDGSNFGELVAFGSPMEEKGAFKRYLIAQAAVKHKSGINLHIEGLGEEMRGGYIDADGGERHFTEDEIQSMLAEERTRMDEEYEKGAEEVIAGIMRAYDRLHHRELRNWAVHFVEATPRNSDQVRAGGAA